MKIQENLMPNTANLIKLLFSGLVLFLPCFSALKKVHGQENSLEQAEIVEYQNGDLGVSLSYPSSFERIKNVPSAEVLLLLRSKTEAGYPTLNVIKQSGDPQVVPKSTYQLGIDVVDSYRGVGLYDAEIKHSEKRKFADRDVFYAKIFYSMAGQPTAAAVYIVPTVHYYFVFTFLETEEGFGKSEKLFEQVMKSVKLRDPAPKYAETSEGKVVIWWFVGVVGLLGGAALISYFFRKK